MADTALLVGGRSRRMGGLNKALLKRDGVSLLERTLSFFDREACFLVGGSPPLYGHLNIRCVTDEIPARGAPGGVYTALCHARTPWVRILPCDLPKMDKETLEALQPDDSKDVVLYRVRQQPQYLVSLWKRSCLSQIEAALHTGNPGFAVILDRLDVSWVEAASDKPFLNMNTPRDAAESGYVQGLG